MTAVPTIARQPCSHCGQSNGASVRRLIFHTFQSPGDVLMLTAAIRDLHLAHPQRFQTDVRTSADALWENNPHVTRLDEHEAGVETIECHYPLVHQANSRPYHFIHGYAQFLEQRLGVPIPLTRFSGDIHLSAEEKQRPLPFAELGLKEGFWIVIAGGKYDFTAKWWDPASYQAVVDHFQQSSRHTPCAVRPRLQFAQCGEAGHWHPRLKNVIDLVGRTSLRDFVLLMHHAAGVLCPVTFAMHLAAAVETRPGKPRRPCVVVAGAREPAHWEQYPGHHFLHTLGSLPCCANDPCWRSRCQLVGDGDEKDRKDVCERPVQVAPELRIAQCMAMITPGDVIRAIELYVGNGEHATVGHREQGTGNSNGVGSGQWPVVSASSEFGTRNSELVGSGEGVVASIGNPKSKIQNPKSDVPVLIDFRHGLGDAVQLTTVLLHLRHYHPDWQIDVAAGIGKLPRVGNRAQGTGNSENSECGTRNADTPIPNSEFPTPNPQAPTPPLYHRLLVRDREAIDRAAYKHVFELSWDECPTCYADTPSTKAEHCLRSVFNLEPIRELCRYEISVGADARAAAKSYLESLCGPGAARDGRYPVMLLHYQGNTSTDQKDLSHELARKVCDVVLDAGYFPVILDWDKRSPLPGEKGTGTFCRNGPEGASHKTYPSPFPDGARIHNPHADSPLWGGIGTGDCEVLAALIAQSALFIGVDSGPLHVAGATIGQREQGTGNSDNSDFGRRNAESRIPNSAFPIPNSPTQSPTPVLAVWTGHHPLHYFALADHVTHLVPDGHESRLRGNRHAGQEFFNRHYRHRVYQQLDEALPALVQELLARDGDGLVRAHDFWVRGDNVEQDLVIVRDIAEQDSYRIAELDVPGPVAVDVGAHIGVFSRAFKRRHPSARVVAVECCPENIAALERNIGDFATIVTAALTYEREVALLNAVYPGCVSTGGSRVVPRSELEDGLPSPSSSERDGLGRPSSEYWLDRRPLPTVSLEQLIAEHNLDCIDVLKLDCEGSEFSILENTTSLDRVGAIIGEYHGRERFLELVARKFSDWHLRIIRDDDPGTFWLVKRRNREQGTGNSENSEVGARNSDSTIPTSAFRIPNSQSADFWPQFLAVVHPVDQPVPESWRQYYTTLIELARQLRPRTVCEIGVRAGYSAFAILSANPSAWMLGVEADLDEANQNTHTGGKGLYQHAEKILAGFNYQLLIADSHALARLPACDLAYIDGDHTFEGCLADLRLAERSTDAILVDDYDSLPDVREACDQFAAERPDFKPRYIANGLTGFLLFQRRHGKAEGKRQKVK